MREHADKRKAFANNIPGTIEKFLTSFLLTNAAFRRIFQLDKE